MVHAQIPEPFRCTVPYIENFNGPWSGGAPSNTPNIWSKGFVRGTTNWVQYNGCLYESPYTSPAGGYNAMFYQEDWSEPETRLITPPLDFGTRTSNAKLSFWHAQREWAGDQDTLGVYYRNAVWNPVNGIYNGTWYPLASYTEDIPDWTYTVINLPNPGSCYQVGFLGYAYYGFGIGLDEVQITGVTQATSVQFAKVQFYQMDVSWTRGDGDNCAVFIKQASSGTASPANNATYTANTAFGSGLQIGSTGWYCIYNGSGTSVTVTGLTPGTTYQVHVCEYTGEAGSEEYAIDSATDNPDNQTTVKPSVAFTNGGNAALDFHQTNTTGPQSNWLCGQFSLAGNASGATLNSVTITLSGSYDASDLQSTPFQLYASNTNSFGSAAAIGSSVSDPGSGNDLILSSLSDGIPSGTRYYWITADLSAGATSDDNMNGTIDGTDDLSITNGTISEASVYGKLNAGDDASLPVCLVSFSAGVEGASIILEWITESELENLGFNIYRSIDPNTQFNIINDQLIPGAGTSSSRNEYEYIDKDVTNGLTYLYKLEDVDYSGDTELHGPVLAIPVAETTPADFYIANHPNPFNLTTSIEYSVPKASNVILTIYNMNGQVVDQLVNQKQEKGFYSVNWNAQNVSTGVYFYQIKADGFQQVKKMLLIK